jgi:hypothetical protein
MTTRVHIPAGTRMHSDLRSAVNHWQNVVLELDSIGAVTTEVVRLRAAKHHDCHT